MGRWHRIRNRIRRCFLAIAAATGLSTVATFAHAQNNPAIDRARAALELASSELKGANTGKQQLAALGKAVTAHEAALSAYRDGLRALATRESRMRTEIDSDRVRLEELISALQSLAQAPRSALMAFPGGPVGAARGASLMGEISPVLSGRIDALRVRLNTLRQVRSNQEVARIEARGALASLQELRGRTNEALRRRRKRDLATDSELQEQADAAAAQAANISELASALKDAAREDPDVLLSFTEARGFVRPPVTGTLAARFRDPDPWNRPGYGVTLNAPAYAQVSAPWDGTIRFAGPLIDYGTVVVLEPEQGTLIVMAGLASVDRLVGETVLSGERLGGLGGPIPASDEFLLEASTDRDQIREETLYIELRRDGEPIDPELWFDFAEKGNGG